MLLVLKTYHILEIAEINWKIWDISVIGKFLMQKIIVSHKIGKDVL